ncbi:MAG TPA: hypothetical protein VKN99_15735 [Polyangia bacterium]|nr:hypothetical protein [Polyangia bacterium]
MRTLLHTLTVLALVLAGCGNDKKPPPPDGMTVTPPPATVHDNNMDVPAIYACNGSRMDPAGSPTEFMVNGKVADFQSGSGVAGAVISVFPDTAAVMANQPYDTKTCDNAGNFTALKIPANHYRVAFKSTATDQIDTFEFGIPIPPGTTTTTRNSVSRLTATALPTLVGIDYDMTKAAVAGGVRDCGPAGGGLGRFVKGALIAVTVGGAPVPDGQVFYFSDNDLPVRKTQQQWTNTDGLFTALNLPSGMATVEARAVLTAGSQPVVVGREMVPLMGGSLSIVDVSPLAH